MARLFLSSGENYSTVGAGSNEVFGFASGAEVVHVAGNGDAIFDATFNQGGDTIYIDGNAADYRVVLDGTSRILLTSLSGASINIPVGGVGANIIFNDADRVLKFVGSSAKLGDQTVTSTAAAVAAGVVEDDQYLLLQVNRDNLVGGAGDDTFDGGIAQNNNGEQANTLGTGDRLDGQGGDNDTLIGTIQDASPLNDTPSSSIAPIIRDVEDIQLTAFQAWDGLDENVDDDGLGIATGVGVNAKSIFGVERLGSFHSDTSMTYFNVNTLLDDSDLGDEDGARRTSDITIRMERTGPASPLNDVADFTVLFDNDYLLRAPNTAAGATIRIQMMDLDSALTGLDPLLNNPYNSFQFTIGGELVTLPINLTTSTTYEAVAAGFQAALDANPLTAGKVNAVLGPVFSANDTDSDPGGSANGIEILLVNDGPEILTPIRFNADDGVPTDLDFHLQTFQGEATETNELITSIIELEKVGNLGDGGYLTVGGMAVVGSDHYYDSLLENTWQYGAIPRPGVEKFIVHVEGVHNSVVDESSSLAGLQSTHNALQWVVIDNPGSTADLTIGNSQTHDITGVNGATAWVDNKGEVHGVWSDAVDVSSGRNNAVKDVLVFDASEFTAKSTVWAIMTDEMVDKYTYLADFQANPRVDNTQGSTGIEADYEFGSGDNTFNLNISKGNAAFLGNATREDFELNIETNGGNDLVQLQIGDGSDEPRRGNEDLAADWYNNHAINAFGYVGGTQIGNDRYEDMQIIVSTSGGQDKIETWGATTVYIKPGSEDDVVFTDNSGEYAKFNEGHATWVFNSNDRNVNDLQSQTRVEATKIANLGVSVTFQDIEVRVPVNVGTTNSNTGATITDLTIVQAIKDAINNDPVLSDVLVALDGPGRTLIVMSKIDGYHTSDDLTLNLFDTAPLSTQQTNAGATLFSTWLANPANATAAASFDWVANLDGTYSPIDGQVDGAERWDSQFGRDGHTLHGVDSDNTNNNVVDASLGNDTIVLSSFGDGLFLNEVDADPNTFDQIHGGEGYRGEGFGSVETIDIDGLFGDDVILNFTAAIGAEGSNEVQVFSFSGEANDDGDASVTIDDGNGGFETFTVTVDADETDDTNPTTGAEVAAALAEQINDYFDDGNPTTIPAITAAVIGGQVTLTYNEPSYNAIEVECDVNPEDPTEEVQTLVLSAPGAVAAGTMTVTFGSVSVTIDIGTPTTDTPAEIAAAIAAAFDDSDFDPSNLVSVVYPADADGAGPALITPETVQLTWNPGDQNVSPMVVEIDQPNPIPGSTFSLDYDVNTLTDGFDFGLDCDHDTLQQGLPPVGGWDIFDLTTVMGPAVPANFINELAAHTDEPDGGLFNEPGDISFATLNGGTVAIIDTVVQSDYAFTGTPIDETARILQIARDTDVAASPAGTGTLHSVVITVDADNKGTFYHIANGALAKDVTVTRLGSAELGEYDSAIKDAIGDWNQMTIANFTPLTAETIVDTFLVA